MVVGVVSVLPFVVFTAENKAKPDKYQHGFFHLFPPQLLVALNQAKS